VSLSIHVHSTNGAVVVALAGTADASMLQPVAGPLTAALDDTKVLVLDLDDLDTVDVAGMHDLITGVLAPARGGQLRIAASRAATMASLAQTEVHHLVPVHRSVGDALAADYEPPRA
jgi:anti-anti-sigma factor